MLSGKFGYVACLFRCSRTIMVEVKALWGRGNEIELEVERGTVWSKLRRSKDLCEKSAFRMSRTIIFG